MGDLFERYPTAVAVGSALPAFDEMFSSAGKARASYKKIHETLAKMTQDELRGRTEALASSYLAQGVTFDFAGEERPFPLDAVPRVIEKTEWNVLDAGVKQRVRVLEAFLADVYGSQNAVRDGVVPAALIASSAHFHRAAHGIDPANGVRIQVSGIDLVRDEVGTWRVLEDNVRVPSGVSYVISNRRVMAQTLPELFQQMRIQPVGEYPNKLLAALRAAAPSGVEDPVVVVLTPGVYNSAYFEHTLLARLMGLELVEGRDLFVKDEVFDLDELLAERVDDARFEAESRRIRVRFDAENGLQVRAVPELLHRAIENVLRNALRYSPDEGELRVAIHALPNQRCRISVQDQGPGVPESELEHIFEAFRRHAARGEGYGLGLAIARRVMHTVDGSIQAKNRKLPSLQEYGSTSVQSGTKDLGLARSSANNLGVTNGSSTTYWTLGAGGITCASGDGNSSACDVGTTGARVRNVNAAGSGTFGGSVSSGGSLSAAGGGGTIGWSELSFFSWSRM